MIQGALIMVIGLAFLFSMLGLGGALLYIPMFDREMTQKRTIGFIDAGRVTRILLAGLQRQNALPATIMVHDCNAGAVNALKTLAPAEVLDLIPVEPLAEMESQVTEMYRTRLPTLYQQIKP